MLAAARHTNKPGRRQWRRSALPVVVLVLVVLSGGAVAYHLDKQKNTTPHSTTKQAQQKTSTTSGTPADTPTTTSDTVLTAQLQTWAQKYTFSSSVYVQELTGQKRTASYQASTSFIPASTYKIYVAYAILHGVEQGTYTLDTTTDTGKTIGQTLTSMIVNSDNEAARTLGFLYGWKNINALLQAHGMTHTDLYNYIPPSTLPQGNKYSTAQDLATALTGLYSGSLLNTDHTSLLLGLMKQQQYRQRIPAGVPSGIVVADKPGWLSPADGQDGYIENDAGIVYGAKSTYILIILTTGSTTQPLADLSQQVYSHLQQ